MAADERSSDDNAIPQIVPADVELIDRRGHQPHSAAAAYGSPPQLRSRRTLALFLFVATCASTFLSGSGLAGEGASGDAMIRAGFTYSFAIMGILLAHEMGHYLQARRYRVPASLPYFIPFPISPFGTMGAVIVQVAGVANRKAMFDIAVSGPLAGLVLTFPILWIGLQHAGSAPLPPNHHGLVFGDPLILTWMFEWMHGAKPAGYEIELNPLLFAGWVGVFITALNLIPIGQLDGGHILYTLIGRRAHSVAILLVAAAIAYMVFTANYAYSVMLFLLLMMGPRHPPTADDTVPLGWFRVLLGWLTLGFIIVGFTPTPIV